MSKLDKDEKNNSGKGTNIENSEVISKDARDSIQKNQEDTRKLLKKEVPNVSVSEELSNIKLSDLDLSEIQVPYGVNLSSTTIKDVVDPTKFDFAKDDLSGLTEEHLDMNQLVSMGFSAFSYLTFSTLAISLLIKVIRNKIQESDKQIKTKIIASNQSITTTNETTSTSVDKTSTAQTNLVGNNTTQYNTIDQYSKKRNHTNRMVNNSPYSVDQRQRSDILESTKAVSTKKSTLVLKNNPNYGKYFNSFNI
jgi:hypothetical protein